MDSEALNEIIFGDLLRDQDQDIFSKSSKRVKLIIDKTVYIITGFRKDKFYLHLIPMLFQGSKSYHCEWKPGDNIFELIHELLKNELNKEKKIP